MSRIRIVARSIGRRVETTSAPIAAAMNRMTMVVGARRRDEQGHRDDEREPGGSRRTLIRASLRGVVPGWYAGGSAGGGPRRSGALIARDRFDRARDAKRGSAPTGASACRQGGATPEQLGAPVGAQELGQAHPQPVVDPPAQDRRDRREVHVRAEVARRTGRSRRRACPTTITPSIDADSRPPRTATAPLTK